jgi:serine/threonine protein kinase
LGTHIETQQKVAIKIIPKDSLMSNDGSAGDPNGNGADDKKSLNKKLEREIAIMKLIQHPSVMQLYDVYETEKDLYVSSPSFETFSYLVRLNISSGF